MKEMIENEAAIFVVGGVFAFGFVVLTLPIGPALRLAGQATGGRAMSEPTYRPLRRPGPEGQAAQSVT